MFSRMLLNRLSLRATLLVPMLFVITCSAMAQQTRRVEIDGEMYWGHSDDDHSYSMTLEGDVVFKSDDSGIESLSRGGHVVLEAEEDGVRRKLKVENGRNGLTFEYTVNGRRIEYTPAVERELESFFLFFIRESGVNAEARVARFLGEGGPDAVFSEIDVIESPSSVGKYARALVNVGDLNTRNLNRTVALVSDRISSSGDKARFARDVSEFYLANPGTYDAYFGLITSVGSSGDRSRVLLHLLAADLDREAWTRSIEAATSISSSGDKTRVLIGALGTYTDDARVRDLYFTAVESIDSSGDRSRLLRAALTELELDADTAERVYRAAAGISSNGDKARVLLAAVPFYSDTQDQREAFFEAVDAIGSAGDRSRVLLGLLADGQIGQAGLERLLSSVQGIHASGDASRVLVRAAPLVEDEQVESYLAAAESIGASGDRSRALKALMDR